MAQITKVELTSWQEGCNNSSEGDLLPPTAFPVGRNTALVSVSAGQAVVAKRKGMSSVTPNPPNDVVAVCNGIHGFGKVDSDFHQILQTLDDGRSFIYSTSGSGDQLLGTTLTPAPSPLAYLPSFADANGFCFIVNGIDAVKYDPRPSAGVALSLSKFGIAAPTTAPTLADSGDPGTPIGTYESRVTFYNSVSGEESSAGPTSGTVVLASTQLRLTAIPVSSDPQVDTRRIFIRNATTQANFYLVATLADNTSTGIADIDFTDSALIEVGPDDAENNPPPAGARFAAFHRSRMFVATPSTLFYSKINHPEAFDPEAFELVDNDNTQDITGIISIFDVLVILKTHSVYVLTGDDPDTWSIRQIDPVIGNLAPRSIVATPGALFWWGENGPVMWSGGDHPAEIATPYISMTVAPENLSQSPNAITRICGAYDSVQRRVLWAIPEVGQTRNTLILPFNTRIFRWESEGWDPIDTSAMAAVYDPVTRLPFVALGSYSGEMFKLGDTDADALDGDRFAQAGDTSTGTFTATSTSQSSFTDPTAHFRDPFQGLTFPALTDRKITVVDSDGVRITTHPRPRITTHDATTLTIDIPLDGLTIGEIYTYYIGGPEFEFQTPWLLNGDGFLKKRYLFLYLQSRPDSDVSDLQVDLFVNQSNVGDPIRSQTLSLAAAGAVWDESEWDDADWDGTTVLTQRFRIAHTGLSIAARLRHFAPFAPFTLKALSFLAETLSEKLG